MKKQSNKLILSLILVLIITIMICMFFSNTHANYSKEDEKVLKIGFYSYEPYYYFDKDNKPTGYYNDLIEYISKDLGFKYKYVFCDVSQATDKLEKGEVDLLLGINKTPNRSEKFIYTDHYISVETYGIYTGKDISYGNLDELDHIKFGYIPNEANSDWILELFKERDINIIPVKANSYKEMDKLLINGKVDATISTIDNNSLNKMQKIFEYSAGPVYIAGNKSNQDIISKIDRKLEEYSNSNNNPIEKLNVKYFNKGNNINFKAEIIIIILCIILIICIAFIIFKIKMPYINKIKAKKVIREDLISGNYFLMYQPIINPKKNIIVGFEGLLRLNKYGHILTPYYFLEDIEENDMLFEVSLYILKKAINDYELIRNLENIKNEKIYLSVNMSLNEIENDEFINEICLISKELNMKKDSICIEIVERVGINDLSKINNSIKKLKECGFMLAIDDFGVEYSNLDILEKVDFDIVKLDKYFIDDIDKSLIIKEIVNFLSNLCKITNKTIISEGVECLYQKEIIKNMDNDKFYIQGYFYSKPVDIADINKINID